MATNESILEIIIRARNETAKDIGELKKQIADLQKALGQQQEVKVEATKATDQLKRLTAEAQKAVTSIGGLINNVKSLGKALLGLEVVRVFKDLAKAAAAEELLNTSMIAVARNAGISKTAILEVAKEVKELGFSSEATAAALTKFIRADLPIEKFEQFARGAKSLATVAGTDSVSALNRLTFSIQNLSTRALRQLGLNIQLDTSLKQWADDHNTTTKAMDNHTKSIALMEIVQGKLNAQIEAASATTGLLGKDIKKLANQTDEAKTAIGQNLMPIYQVFITESIKFAKAVRGAGDEMHTFGSGAEEFANSIKPIIVAIREGGEYLVKHIQAIILLAEVYGILRGALILATAAVNLFNAATEKGPAGVIIRILGAYLILLALVAKQAYDTANAVEEADKKLGDDTFLKKRNTAVKELLETQAKLLAADIAGSTIGGIPAAAGRGVLRTIKALIGLKETLAQTEQEAQRLNKALGDGPTTEKGLKEHYRLLFDLQEAQLDGEKKVELARTRQIDLTFEQAKANLEIIKGKIKEQELNLKAYLDAAKKQGTIKDTTLLTIEGGIAQQKQNLEISKGVLEASRLVSEIANITEQLHLNTDEARAGLDIGDHFINLETQFTKLFNIFNSVQNQTDKGLKVTGGSLKLFIKQIVEAAKTPLEIEHAFNLVKMSAQAVGEESKRFYEILKDKAPAAALAELTQRTEIYARNLKSLLDVFALLREVTAANMKTNSDLEIAMAKAGYSISAVRSHALRLTDALVVTAQTMRLVADLEIKASQDVEQQSKATLEAELDRIAKVTAARKANIQKLPTGAAKVDAQLALDQENAKLSTAAWKKRFDEVDKMREKEGNKAVAYAEKIRAIDETLFKLKQDREQKIIDIRQKGMSEVEKNQDNQRLFTEAMEKSESARLRGNLDLARKFSDQAIALNDRIQVSDQATAQEKFEAEDRVNEVYDKREDLEKQNRAEVKKSMDAQVTEFERLSNIVEQVQKQIRSFADIQLADLAPKVNIDPASLTRMTKAIEESVAAAQPKFSDKAIVDLGTQLGTVTNNLTFDIAPGSLEKMLEKIKTALTTTFNVPLTVAAPGKAGGGLITGPGTTTSDSILMRASNKEYMVQARAVEHYGVGFMEAINHMMFPMRLPRFADGGLVGGSTGSPPASRDVVDVNLRIGGQKVTLMGERQQVRTLVSTLKNLDGV